MDKKRKLIIKHPQLREIRDTLRYIIVEEVYKELGELNDEIMEYPVEEKNIRVPIIRKKQALRRALDASICICPICKSQASDMIYNPQLEKWFCVDCYEHNHEWYKTHPHSTERRDAPNPFP